MKSLTDLVGNLDISTEQVLTALRIVATRAGIHELAEWAARELEGYGAEDELPAHRSWRLSIVASLHNPVPLLSHRLSNEGGLNLPCLVE